MKNNLDKIFIVLAFVVLGASCAIYFLGGAAIDEFSSTSKGLMQGEGNGKRWENVDVKGAMPESSASWVLPEAQDKEGKLTFQLFTPPAIWKTLDTGALLTSLPKRESVIQSEKKADAKKYAVCEVDLAGISNGAYRIKLNGYIGDPENPTFEFEDIQKNILFSGKKDEPLKYKDPSDISGKTLIPLGLKVINFKRENVKNEDGTTTTVMMVNLADSSIKKNVRLRTDKPTMLPYLRQMKLQATDGKDFLVAKVGDSFDYNKSKYTVTDISFDKRYVVLKQVPADSKILPLEFKLNISRSKPKASVSRDEEAEISSSKAEEKVKETVVPEKPKELVKPTVDMAAKKRSQEAARRAVENAEKARIAEEEELAERRLRLNKN